MTGMARLVTAIDNSLNRDTPTEYVHDLAASLSTPLLAYLPQARPRSSPETMCSGVPNGRRMRIGRRAQGENERRGGGPVLQ